MTFKWTCKGCQRPLRVEVPIVVDTVISRCPNCGTVTSYRFYSRAGEEKRVTAEDLQKTAEFTYIVDESCAACSACMAERN